ncbi:hypothetical protein Syun_027510 [Stephania yunnanensis]|uniref:Uncharacterized protein n=1 Tax=Stephania yunnanensis TaxID=152371 RepID=A0AAP0EG22_9MAGN
MAMTCIFVPGVDLIDGSLRGGLELSVPSESRIGGSARRRRRSSLNRVGYRPNLVGGCYNDHVVQMPQLVNFVGLHGYTYVELGKANHVPSMTPLYLMVNMRASTTESLHLWLRPREVEATSRHASVDSGRRESAEMEVILEHREGVGMVRTKDTDVHIPPHNVSE